jgi:hypothetical protein
MDEPGFLRAGDDADPDARQAPDFGNEIPAVFRFPCGAGGGGDNLVNLVGFGQPLEFGQCLQGGGHSGWRDAAAVQAAGAEPDHVLFAVDDLERQVGAHVHDDHVDRVRADVDGG